ncbi:helix-turn-helix domain-containing protein [Pantoea agglomerans]|uniref:helix-turn-helix domain-containing protein n=1 Tax=Enterobacter agglomerans TaxID=549 RepID=UPI000E219D6E|nr:XRE family transcriptional regulator [Pantoea agglomerans]MCH9406005.1 XRE family transcriptional regulator [Pantoea agglomerans]WNK32746.1 XRE family transcriptional regulator [Pantoea agglomerans]WNK64517.1 XRE family transcriptional regulator [Pantoea agglomerans]
MLDQKSSKEDNLNIRIGQKVKEEREKRGWSLTELADNSGVSRAMIHKIERGESSPTAVLLARLSGSFDMTISQLLAQTEVQTGTLVRHENQPVWQDPETGYLRRHVSPGEMPVDLVSVELPANTAVPMPAISYVSRRQLIWVIEGTLTFEAGSSTYEMAAGDCLELGDPADCVFRNKTTNSCRYAVIVLRPA